MKMYVQHQLHVYKKLEKMCTTFIFILRDLLDFWNASAPSHLIRPFWRKFRIESAIIRAVLRWYPPLVTISIGIHLALTFSNTILSLFIIPWKYQLVNIHTEGIENNWQVYILIYMYVPHWYLTIFLSIWDTIT